jgi:CelD/BcsL family acetyltransferase involved in cellulose biosynthesis
MHDRMYFWGGASLREYQILRPNELLQYQAMTYWKARGIGLYDMGGSGEYKRKYGGYEIAVPWVRKSKYAFLGRLRDTAAQLQRTRQRVLGKCQ